MFNPLKKFSKKALLPYHYLYAKELPKSYMTEAYQKFLVNLEYINIDGHYKYFQITSSVSAEGKTIFIGNIAYLLAKKEEKVIITDLDLRNLRCIDYLKSRMKMVLQNTYQERFHLIKRLSSIPMDLMRWFVERIPPRLLMY